ncbi:16S rRNA (guanine(966)-N(2))-methyltransferase RsmD [Aerococcus sp. 1KP-2016]|jgi:16S rRNA (guanine(966)-N(2))-methyltransferase RsmD|uniref:16S rRNA (guanine(966)-N(2))-methyltransferase RsmD n=1 Tax=Aerococcus sp. 1KP-2016 TaxID=1981982 RepID=UPI000B985F00|nr:16S rRNA (guanine(966)-N(2))-methyltransferase RsmD [Aerococcus sp. 1KP-2016]OYQ66604.1 16S rRNA (guanine(966)-N(2))-methyltransferase RsmD [Aerococcus sp. 1KP-2016]
MRVIAGKYGKHRLKAVPGNNTRPTTDKIKESLFNIIGPYFDEDTRVLDFYAGSGALGIEAISRGAAQVYGFEKNRQAITTIKENVAAVGIEDQYILKSGDNRKAIQQLRREQPDLQFDLVFLDPPYKGQQLVDVIEAFLADHWIAAHGRLVCELSKEDVLPEVFGQLQVIKDVTYGITRLVIYRMEEEI